MKKLIAAIILVIMLTGCGVDPARGYFYIKSTNIGYAVYVNDYTGSPTQISKSEPLAEATVLCDKLNKDLGQSALHEGDR
jgi:hypothetical protein